MTRQILVPIDRSAHSQLAFEYALKEFPNAEITVLHVINPSSYWQGNAEGYIYTEDLADQLTEERKEVLENARQTATEHDREITTELKTGSPAQTITTYVTDHDIDHIVIGSHGRDGFSRILLGSVAETVAKRSPVPVTIVR